jgi:hypothetical protein
MRPNTRIRLEDLTAEDCRQILEIYRQTGLRILESIMDPEHIARELKDTLPESRYIEYRPDGRSQNKLDFGVYSADDGEEYLHVEVRPLDSEDSASIIEKFDRQVRALFI